MFSQLYEFCSRIFFLLLNFFNNFYDMLTTEYILVGFGTYTLLDVIFVLFLTTVVARILRSLATN